MGTGFFGGQHTATQGGVWAAPGRLHVQSVCALVHTGWRGGVGGGWVYLWSGLWPCTPHVLETLAEFPPLQSHCGVRPPRPGVVNPSAHVSSKFSTQHLPATQRAASPSPGAALLHAFTGCSRLSRPRAPLRHRTTILLPVCCPFCPTPFAVPTIRRASHCPVASSALACAPVLRCPFSPLPRRWSCALRLGFSSASSITTSPSTVCRVPVLLRAPAPLCSPPPLLLSVTSLPHPPPPPPTPSVRLPASHLPVPPHAPGPLPLAPALPCPCPALRVATVLSLPLQQLTQHLNPGLLPLLLGTVQAHPWERRPQHPPPPPLFYLRPPFPGPPPPAN